MALDGISLEVPSGQFAAIVGPSGCGKSTLLRLAAGLLQPGQGAIRLDGRPPAQVAAERRLAWMAQAPALLPWRTAQANVSLALRFHRPDRPSRLTPQEALRLAGLAESAGSFPFTLSGGMQRRLVVARSERPLIFRLIVKAHIGILVSRLHRHLVNAPMARTLRTRGRPRASRAALTARPPCQLLSALVSRALLILPHKSLSN